MVFLAVVLGGRGRRPPRRRRTARARRRSRGAAEMIRPLADGDVGAAASIMRATRADGIYSERGIKHVLESMPPRAQGAAWVADEGEITGWGFAHRRWWRATD